ncbi:hypothetical protein T4A_8469 [Trichinella pseudospiralis]|uniref:Uncharacterized protein n=1 Tax=Trichinella pseudospiralis TaxID=6337 RepID=A0A0V1ANP9_TRIPS|nr:hypothetical protein T4A_8469 [Trichinella pseudospiralis]KRY97466.1 hypothetical protein T4C_9195 [Trichinella pseudospiralis]KRY98101.1 hypothetical protein T4C_5024 [Trichinella pseudospiralis]
MVVRILPLRVWFTQFAMECVANVAFSISFFLLIFFI